MVYRDKKFTKVIGLIILPPDTVEKRVAKIIRFVAKEYSDLIAFVDELDATGPTGRFLPEQFETQDLTSIIEMLEEDGQVIDFRMTVENNDIAVQFVITDNVDADIITTRGVDLSEEITGDHILHDPAHFCL